MTEIIVVGGGPVGWATALYARAAGLTVTVVDPKVTPIDKACGEGLMPSTVAQLLDLGVDPVGVDFRGIRYLSTTTDHVASARFRGSPGRGVRRLELQRALASAGEAAGVKSVTARVVDVGWNHRAAAVRTADGALHQADYVIGADGLHSKLRRLTQRERGAPPASLRPSARHDRFGLRRHFAIAPWSESVDVWWAEHAEAYITPVSDHCVGVALLASHAPNVAISWETLLAQFPQLNERLSGAKPVSDVKGAGPLRQRVAQRATGRLILVGDAAGYVDALTGEGLAAGLASAELAIAVIVRGDLGEYDRQWRRVTRRSRLLTELTLELASVPVARRRLVALGEQQPDVFAALVNALA